MIKKHLVDVTQFYARPVRGGIQRVLSQMFKYSQDREDITYFAQSGNLRFLLNRNALVEVGNTLFSDDEGGAQPDKLRSHLWDANEGLIAEVSIPGTFDHFVLPELAYRRDVIGRGVYLSSIMPTTAIFYDLFPELVSTPSAMHQHIVGEYFLSLREYSRVVAISDVARNVYLGRLRPSLSQRVHSDSLGVDHVPSIRPDAVSSCSTTVVAIASLDPRKRLLELLQAWHLLQAVDHHLLLLPPDDGEERMRIREMADDVLGGRARWSFIAGQSDSRFWRALGPGSVFVSLGVEGFGLPALEALALGGLVVADKEMPSVSTLSTGRLILVDGTDVEEVAEAFRRSLMMRVENDSSIELPLPKWQDFFDVIFEEPPSQ